MLKYAALILLLFFGGLLTIDDADAVGTIPPTLVCKNDHNCRIEYHGALADKHVRTSIYVNGEWFITDDLFPENFGERNGR